MKNEPLTQILPGEIVIEIDHPRNSDVSFFPAHDETLRSRMIPTRTGETPPAPYAAAFAINGIPGQRVHLHVKKRVGRVTDPLGDKENDGMCERIKEADDKMPLRNKHKLFPGADKIVPRQTKLYENLSEEDVDTWLFWMEQLVEGYKDWTDAYKAKPRDLSLLKISPHARLVQGKLPSCKELLRTKRIKRPTYIAGPADRQVGYIKPRESLLREPESAGVGA